MGMGVYSKMPYIKRERRIGLVPDSEHLPLDPGELNFQLTNILLDYWDESKGNYQAINDIVGALECAKLEFYRRVVIPYEEGKIKDNGDVY